MRAWTIALALALLPWTASTSALAACATAGGDLAPGVLDETLSPPVWRPIGDGALDVGDVLVSLRVAVELARFEVPGPENGPCALVTGDLAPGSLDETADPPTWTVLGDGRHGVGDVVVALRAAVGLLAIEPPGSHAKLELVSSCEELENGVKQVALQSVEMYGTWSVGWWWNAGGPWVDDMDGDVAAPASPTAGGASGYSDTNVQVEGVDEADIVKTDGRWLHVLSGDGLRILDAWPAESLRLVSRTAIDGHPLGMFLRGDQLVAITQLWDPPSPAGGALIAYDTSQGLTKLSFFDVGDRSAPELVRELVIEGHLQASRRVEQQLTLVTHHALRGPELPAYTGDWESYRHALRHAVEASTLADWLPRYTDSVRTPEGWRTTTNSVFGCTDVHRPDHPDGAGLTAVLTLDLDDPNAFGRVGIFAATGTTYANAEHLYATTTGWPGGAWWRAPGDRGVTRIHAFDIGLELAGPSYFGSGEVPGAVLNQFSLDEYGEHLRIATTTGTWGEFANDVHVLERDEDRRTLDTIGSVTGFAPNERIQSVRFTGPMGWVVTFERVDPLFGIDLSDPRTPTITGELEVTGFSSYLHPLPPDHLIGVGTAVDPDTSRVVGVQVSLFDVSNVAQPLLRDRDVVEAGWSSSEAQHDHHAFTYFPEEQALAIPLIRSEWSPEGWWTGFNGLRVYRVDPVTGIDLLGELDAEPLTPGLGPESNPWCRQVRRGIFLEDYLYAVAEGGVIVARLDALDEPVALVPFRRDEGCWYDVGGLP